VQQDTQDARVFPRLLFGEYWHTAPFGEYWHTAPFGEYWHTAPFG